MKLFVNTGSNIEWDEQDLREMVDCGDVLEEEVLPITSLAVGQSYEDSNDTVWRRVQ